LGLHLKDSYFFICKGYGGRASEKFIVEDSSFLDCIDFGDLILADRGFTIHESVPWKMGSSKIPSFVGKRNQLNSVEEDESRDLARVRVHVERVIGAVSQRFSILNGPLHHQCLFANEASDSQCPP